MQLNHWMRGTRRKIATGSAALLLAVAGTSGVVGAQEKSPFSLSVGTDFTSHFISYGADVWGGGNDASPFGSDATMFVYETIGVAFSDNLSGFVNVWSDVNDNADSNIGGIVQEVDLNIGLTYTYEKWAFTLAHGCWWYASDTEHVIDFTVAYNDADMFSKGFALNPSVNFHYRYEGNGGQEEGWAIVGGIKPTYTLMADSQYPIGLSAPMNIAFFDDEFQGGDGGFAYASIGVGAGVPLAFIPAKYGHWSASASLTYYCTEESALPGNSEQGFFVTALSLGFAM